MYQRSSCCLYNIQNTYELVSRNLLTVKDIKDVSVVIEVVDIPSVEEDRDMVLVWVSGVGFWLTFLTLKFGLFTVGMVLRVFFSCSSLGIGQTSTWGGWLSCNICEYVCNAGSESFLTWRSTKMNAIKVCTSAIYVFSGIRRAFNVMFTNYNLIL